MTLAHNTISILGCGWLGQAVAKRLLTIGYKVQGSTTQIEKIPVLRAIGITPFELKVDTSLHGIHLDAFFNVPYILIMLPFKRNLEDPTYYCNQLHRILSKCPQNAKLIFTSSTSIYPLNNKTFTEETYFQPSTPRSKALYDTEQIIRVHHPRSLILRLGGLYGPNRPIGKFLSNKTNIANPDGATNLIHVDDVVAIISELILRHIEGITLNVVSDTHPTRRHLYTQKAQALGLTPPIFDETTESASKIISNQKLKSILGYRFLHPDPEREL